MLINIEIFKVLRYGNGSRANLIKRAWGRPLLQNVQKVDSEEDNLTKQVLSKFERLLLNILSRIIDPDFGTDM